VLEIIISTRWAITGWFSNSVFGTNETVMI
jgi:hypothetical protein